MHLWCNIVGENKHVTQMPRQQCGSVFMLLLTSRRCSKDRMAWRLSSSAWLCWHCLWLCAAASSWLWVRARWSSSCLRTEATSLHFAACSFSCPSRRRFRFSKSTCWASRPAAADLACCSSSITWLKVKDGARIVGRQTRENHEKNVNKKI